jgi:hypothetical protein
LSEITARRSDYLWCLVCFFFEFEFVCKKTAAWFSPVARALEGQHSLLRIYHGDFVDRNERVNAFGKICLFSHECT